jgi:hypothetical protein
MAVCNSPGIRDSDARFQDMERRAAEVEAARFREPTFPVSKYRWHSEVALYKRSVLGMQQEAYHVKAAPPLLNPPPVSKYHWHSESGLSDSIHNKAYNCPGGHLPTKLTLRQSNSTGTLSSVWQGAKMPDVNPQGGHFMDV